MALTIALVLLGLCIGFEIGWILSRRDTLADVRSSIYKLQLPWEAFVALVEALEQK